MKTPKPQAHLRFNVEAFWSRVEMGDGCWIWKGSLNRYGYGLIHHDGKGYLAHRVSYQFQYGPPDELCVLHRCDNPPCVRPSHLFLGTISDNNADRASKRREKRGTEHHSTPFTDLDIHEIRRQYASGQVSAEQIGAERGVSDVAILNIVHRKTWDHLSEMDDERFEFYRPPGLIRRGAESPCAKLTDEDRVQIRARYAIGLVSMRALAKEFHVGFSTIQRLLKGQANPNANTVRAETLRRHWAELGAEARHERQRRKT